MSDTMIIAVITAIVGPVITIFLTHYLQKRKKNGEHSDRVVVEIKRSGSSSPASETLKAEDRTYYDARIIAIMNFAVKRSAAIKKGSVILFLLPIAFGIFIGIVTEQILTGFAVWFCGLALASLAHTVELYDSKKCIANEVALSKLDRSALFEVRTRIENARGIYPELRGHMAQTIDRELKNI